MIKFILEFNNHTYIKYRPKTRFTIKDLFINTINNIYINDFTKNINNYYFIKDNILIHPDSNIIYNDTSHHTVIHIKCFRKQYGGFFSIGDMITDGLSSAINPIIAPIQSIADVFIAIFKFLKWSGLFVYWLWFFAVWLFTDLLNPRHFVDDFFNTIRILIMTLFSSIFNILMSILKFSINIVGGWTQGFWGWDQTNLTNTDMESNYFKHINKNTNKKCYLTNTNTIPFSIVLGTVLCPPIGVFMDMGLTGWFNIFICFLLTLFFYVPGLIYALLIIYS